MISVTINSGIKRFDELNRHDTKPDDLSKYKRVEVGDIAYNSMRMWQGASGYSPYSGILSPAYTVITPKNDVSARFFAYVLKQPKMIHQFEINSQGLTKDTWNLKFPAFAPIEVKAPITYEEQAQIATILLQVDDLITLHQRNYFQAFFRENKEKSKQKKAISWEQRKFADIASTRRGLTYSPQSITAKGIRVLRSSNINEDTFVLSDDDVFVCQDAVNIELVKNNDILITSANGSTRLVGKHAIIVGIGDKTTVHGGFMLVATATNPFFLNASMGSSWYARFISLFVAGGNGAIGNLSKSDLDAQFVHCPNDKEQKRIGVFFNNLDNLITLHQRKGNAEMVLYKLWRSKGEERKNCIAWEQRKVSEIANRYDNLRIPVAANLRIAGTTPYYGANGIQDYVDGFTHEGEFVLVAEDGANDLKNYPVKCVNGRIWVNNHAHVLQSKPNMADNKYLAFAISQADIESLLVGGGRAKLNAEVMMNILLVLPNTDEQTKIGQFMNNINDLITLHQRKGQEKTGLICCDVKVNHYQKNSITWEQRKLGELVERVVRKNENMESNLPLTVSAEYGLVDQITFFNNRVASQNISGYYLLYRGDFAYNKSTSASALWGAVKRLDLYENGVLSTLYIVFKPKKISSEFLLRYYETDYWHPEMKKIASEGARNHGLLNISPIDFFESELKVPVSSKEQELIGEMIREVSSLITLHQRKEDVKKEKKKHQKMVSIINPKCNSWEQRKVGEILAERNEQSPQSDEYPLMAFIANEGVAPKGDRYDRSSLVNDVAGKPYKKTEFGDFIYSSNNLETGSIGLNKYGKASISPVYSIFSPTELADPDFIGRRLVRKDFINDMVKWRQGVIYGQWRIHESDFIKISIYVPSIKEQSEIGKLLDRLDDLITLHQRGGRYYKKEYIMAKSIEKTELFCDYFERWIKVYKDGAIRKVTMNKYMLALSWLRKLIPSLQMGDMDRIAYQKLLNDYAKYHERQTTMDFHHQLKGAILDAVDEGLIPRDPTRKAIIKGKTPRDKKPKYLSQFELHSLLRSLDLGAEVNWDWLILLVAKTGMRFSEALAITPKDFDFPHQTLSISKTWDYKGNGGFLPTKNKSSVRKIQLDWQTVVQFTELTRGKDEETPLFVNCKVYNSTINDVLRRRCKQANIPVISVHGLRHTHASLLLFAGVSIASVARRLGHSSMTTTQKTYLHIIHELENKDIDLVMRALSSL